MKFWCLGFRGLGLAEHWAKVLRFRVEGLGFKA